MSLDLTIERTYPTVITVRQTVPDCQWEQWYLLRSDAHHDSWHCDQALEKRHLEQAKEKNAGILDFGDCFDCMGGRYDRRADPKTIRPELREGEYFDSLVGYVTKAYLPYAENWLMFSPGNHETAVRKHAETCLTTRLCDRMGQHGSRALVGTYAGWIRFMFTQRTHVRQSIKLRYTHGYGGGGPVTRDMIQAANRQLVYTDADIMVSGHVHDLYSIPIRRESLLDSGRPILRDIEVIKTGSYKNEYEPGEGWSVEKGHAPKTLGAMWLRFYIEDKRVCFETRRAQ